MTSPEHPPSVAEPSSPPDPAPPGTPQHLLNEVLHSDSPATGAETVALAGSVQLAAFVSAAVTSTPGVVRIEPTLKNAIVKLTAATRHMLTGISRTGPDEKPDRYLAVDGISVAIRDDHADVSVDLVVDLTRPARTTAYLTHANIEYAIHEVGLVPGHTTIRILAVEYPHSPAA